MKPVITCDFIWLTSCLMFSTSTAHAAGYSHKRAIQMVRNEYCGVLERPLDQSGMVTYAVKLERGKMTAKDLIRALVKSAEHQKRFFEIHPPNFLALS